LEIGIRIYKVLIFANFIAPGPGSALRSDPDPVEVMLVRIRNTLNVNPKTC
jgi:hypothetical protein